MNKKKKWIPAHLPLRDDLTSWRGIMKDIHTNLIDSGLVQTADTGQLDDFDNVLSLPADNVSAGYRVYELNDALSATHPIYIKLEFGMGIEGYYSTGSYNRSRTPRVWVTISEQTNGAGGSLGVQTIRYGCPQSFHNASSGSQSNTNYGVSYYSRNDDHGFYGFVYGVGSRNRPGDPNYARYWGSSLQIFIQRDNTSGVAVLMPAIDYSDNTPNNGDFRTSVAHANYVQYLPFSGIATTASREMANRITHNFSTYGGNTILQPVFYYSPASGLNMWKGVVTYKDTDIVEGTEFSLEVVETEPKNFVALSSNLGMWADVTNRGNGAFAMLFDDD